MSLTDTIGCRFAGDSAGWGPVAAGGLRPSEPAGPGPGSTLMRHWRRPGRSVTWKTTHGRRQRQLTIHHFPSHRRPGLGTTQPFLPDDVTTKPAGRSADTARGYPR